MERWENEGGSIVTVKYCDICFLIDSTTASQANILNTDGNFCTQHAAKRDAYRVRQEVLKRMLSKKKSKRE